MVTRTFETFPIPKNRTYVILLLKIWNFSKQCTAAVPLRYVGQAGISNYQEKSCGGRDKSNAACDGSREKHAAGGKRSCQM